MRRAGIWLTLGLAVVIGIATGFALFTRVGPIPIPSRSASSSPPPTGGSAGTASPSGPASATSPGSPTPSGDPSDPSSTPSATPAPPFTAKALLQPAEFNAHGWGSATVTQTWDELPDDAITSCTSVEPDDGKILAAHAATFRGRSTTAGEVVVRFDRESAARIAVQRLIDRIGACADRPDGEPPLTAEPLEAPEPDGITEIYLWDTTAGDGSSTQGAIGLARAGDRIALLTMTSSTTDPLTTTEVGELTLQAGRRLV